MSRSQAKRIQVRQSLAKRLRGREAHWQFMRAYYVDPPLLSNRVIDDMRAKRLARKAAHRIDKDLARIKQGRLAFKDIAGKRFKRHWPVELRAAWWIGGTKP